MDKIIEINSAVNGFVWGPIMLALLVGTGIYLSFRVGFIQFSKIGYWWKNTIGKIFQKSEAGEGEITPMPGGLHGAGVHGRHGQHRRRHRRDHPRRPGRGVLDVDLRSLRHGHQVRRGHPRGQVP